MILSYAIWTPIIFGLIILFYGSEKPSAGVRWLALVGSIIGFIATLPLIISFDTANPGMQFVEKISWIPRYDINYYLGIDGISVWFIVLTAFINIFVVIAAWEVIDTKVSQYMASFMILSGLMIGVFAALDALLFYVFFEATLIPMYIIIGVWGGHNRIYAAFKFFLYTLLGSLLTLVAMLYLYNVTNTFDILAWQNARLDIVEQILLFAAFFMAFAVKVPMWPLHTWLPDVHVEAPTGGSVVLAAIMLKLGAYGFLRFSLPIAPDASQYLGPFVIFLSLVAVIYVGAVALVQKDMKKLVAYSSVAHMGFVTLGFFLFSPLGIEGGIVQMTRHLAVYWAKDRVRVNCLSPGPFPSDKAPQAMVERLKTKNPMGRMGTPQEVANCVVFLAGTPASFALGTAGNAFQRLSSVSTSAFNFPLFT